MMTFLFFADPMDDVCFLKTNGYNNIQAPKTASISPGPLPHGQSTWQILPKSRWMQGLYKHGTSFVSLIPLAPLSLVGFYM